MDKLPLDKEVGFMFGKKKKFPPWVLFLSSLFFVLTGAFMAYTFLSDLPGDFSLITNEEPTPFVKNENDIKTDPEIIVGHKGNECSLSINHLPQGISDLDFAEVVEDDILALLDGSWELSKFTPSVIALEYKDILCIVCRDLKFIGIFDGKIAIYSGAPPEGVLEEITEYEVKDIYKEELIKGIPFSTEKEKKTILESYTT